MAIDFYSPYVKPETWRLGKRSAAQNITDPLNVGHRFSDQFIRSVYEDKCIFLLEPFDRIVESGIVCIYRVRFSSMGRIGSDLPDHHVRYTGRGRTWEKEGRREERKKE